MRLVRKQIKSTISNENLDTSGVLHNVFRIATGKYLDCIQTVAQSGGPFLWPVKQSNKQTKINTQHSISENYKHILLI